MIRTLRSALEVPYFRPSITESEIEEVTTCLRSGWLTTGSRTKQFEQDLAAFVGAKYAVAVNSCTAALHLSVAALRLQPGQAVLVPTMTFAATAEVVRYQGAFPVLVDCDPVTLNLDLQDAARKLEQLKTGHWPHGSMANPVGIMPVHVGGLMVDLAAVRAFAAQHDLWVVEDAAHALPAAYREGSESNWIMCGRNTANFTCFSFYANKTITTGEGGAVVTDDLTMAELIRRLSLHGLSHDAWKRYSKAGSWDYLILDAGYKYNMTDIAASIGIHQLQRAEGMRREREEIANYYGRELANIEQLELPPMPADRIHAWHLYPIRLRLDRLLIDRAEFVTELREHKIGCSVHWRPLHLHPYYQETCGYDATDCPVANSVWERLISLPIFPGMRTEQAEYVVEVIRHLCRQYAGVRRSVGP